MFGLGVNRLGRLNSSIQTFTPASLFNNGEAGVWYDPSAASGSLDWRRNLLEYTESFDNSYWTPTRGSISAASITDPTGGTGAYSWTATEFTETYIDRRQGISKTVGSTVTLSCFIKKETADYCHLLLWDSSANGVRCWFNLVNGSVGSNTSFGSTYTFNDASVTDAGNGWYRCVLTVNASAGSSVVGRFSPSNGDGNTNSSVGKSIYIFGAQLEEASTASSYQPILSTFENAFKAAFPSHTLYQDYQGVTPVTAVGEPVGLMLDKSKGLKQGPELITNGDFSNGTTDWISSNATLAVIDNALQITSTGGNRPKAYQSISTVVGRFYTISATARIGYSNLDAEIEISGIGAPASGRTNSSIDTRVFSIFRATATNHILQIKIDDATVPVGDIVYFDNVSVTEIQGSHATQPTSTKRPIYARHPEGGIRNLLNYTEQFDNGFWGKSDATVIPNAIQSPTGDSTADKIFDSGLASWSGVHLPNAGVTVTSGKTYTFSIFVKNAGLNWVQIGGSTPAFAGTYANVNLTTGEAGNSNTSVSVSDVGNGWYRVTISAVCIQTNANGSFFVAMYNSDVGSRLPTFSGQGSDGLYIWGAQLEQAAEASNYQKVVTDIDVTESGVGEVYYLKFDGTDDGMFINNLSSPSTPLTALFGYKNEESSGNNYLLDIQIGRLILAASYATTPPAIALYDGAWRAYDNNAVVDGTHVSTFTGKTGESKLRVDGTEEATDTFTQRALSGTVGLFRRYDDTQDNFVKGNMYQTILRAAESTDEEIAKAETYVANKTGLKAQVDGIATLDLNFGANLYTAKNSNGGVI